MVVLKKQDIIQKFRTNEKDTGSTEVQVALLTHGINELNQHCIKSPKDFSSRRGLLKMVNRRKSLLSYFKDENQEKYKNLIEQLGLRK